ncbi:MAG: hypothetical protein CMM01_25500 [Rhodopirellula sp.]|nr:hypothetical protein [Rhodopirellula sp.]
MKQKSWQLDRRTLLRGVGASLALPWMDAMAWGENTAASLPTRFCCVYFPFGVAVPREDDPSRQWGWFPTGEGKDFKFTHVLNSLEALRDNVTVIGGISHPNGWAMGGHDTGDIYLTGSLMKNGVFTNTISLDQRIAEANGADTRFSSLTLSSDGGVGEPTRSCTLSFSREGRPIPALSSPSQIFARLFGDEQGGTRTQQLQQLRNTSSMLDRVLEHSKQLNRSLGANDQRKFDEYLSSVRTIEQRVERAEAWLDVPKPEVSRDSLDFDATQQGPIEYIKAIYELMYLAFQTDSTRVATYMIGQVAGATTIANAFPSCIGLSPNWHGLAHGAGKAGGIEKLGRFDQFLAQNHAAFLSRLNSTNEGDGTLLDRTIVLYGSSNSKTHNNHNYPLLLAGGRGLGLTHGQYLKYSERDMRLSNLYATVLHRLGVTDEGFSDSTGEMTDILA